MEFELAVQTAEGNNRATVSEQPKPPKAQLLENISDPEVASAGPSQTPLDYCEVATEILYDES